MTNLKTLLLVSAASYVAVGEVVAADLPVKAKPVEYVKVCTLYGDGYYYIPGTDTCIKIGGYLRAEMDVNAGGTLTPGVGPVIGGNRDYVMDRESQQIVQRTRFLWTFDTRTPTEYGALRSYARTGIQWTTGDSVNVGSNASAYIDRAFLQFAGLTAGRTVSFFDIYSFSLHSYNTNIIGSDSGGTGINLFAFTKELGNGLSASISAEERTSRDKPIINTFGTVGFFNLTAANGLGTGTLSSQGGQTLPNFVGNLRFDQAWGALQVSAAAHKVTPAYYSTGTAAAAGGTPLAIGGGAGGLTTLGHPDDAWGYAATIGTVLNLPTGKGDTFGAQFVYGKGASAYVGQGQGSLIVYNGSDIALGFVTDGVYGPSGSSVDLTTGMSLIAGLQHYWSPNWRTSLYGGYERFQFNQTATNLLCTGLTTGPGSAANAGGFTPANCNPNFGFWQVGSRTIWNPVKELDIGVDVLYNRIDTAFGGPVNLSANGTQPAGLRFAKDEGVFSAVVRVQRNFLP